MLCRSDYQAVFFFPFYSLQITVSTSPSPYLLIKKAICRSRIQFGKAKLGIIKLYRFALTFIKRCVRGLVCIILFSQGSLLYLRFVIFLNWECITYYLVVVTIIQDKKNNCSLNCTSSSNAESVS